MIVERKGTIALLRDLEARRNARQYLHESERLDAMSQDLFRQESIYLAEGAAYWSRIALRAAEAEMADPR